MATTTTTIELKASEIFEKAVANSEDTALTLKREMKRIASAKCIWLKKKGRADYEERLSEILKEEQLLKEVRTYMFGTKKTVTTFEQADVDRLTHDETVRAIKSIQSKRALTRWLTTTEGDNDEYRNACRIEDMLQEHLKNVRPIADNMIRKSDLQQVIELIELNPGMNTDRILEILKD